MSNNMTAQQKKEQEHNEIIERYNRIQKQQSFSFNAILILMVVIFTTVFFVADSVLFGMGASCVFAMFAFMGHLGYFLVEGPIAEGDYNYVMNQRGKTSC